LVIDSLCELCVYGTPRSVRSNIIKNPVIWKDYTVQFAVQAEAVVRCVAETKRAKFAISDYVSRNANEPS
jgi:hypothetical protein